MNMLQTMAVALVGAAVFELLRVPAGALIGSLVGVAAYNIAVTAGAATLPGWSRFVAFAVLGWLIGQSMTRETLVSLRADLWSITVIVGSLMAVSAVVAIVLTRTGVLDGTTAFLASSPGGLSQMTALGNALDADVAYVATVHLTRVVLVLLSAPLVARLVDAA
ncbi:MAG: AbrB family transcriptional regulator [Acidimicrobiales bacterium]